MTQAAISIEQAKLEVKPFLEFFRDRGINSAVRGGFVRDAVGGVPAKDIDIYVTTPAAFSNQSVSFLAKEFFDHFGRTFKEHKRKKADVMNEVDGHDYNVFLTVFSEEDPKEGTWPIDLIFPPGGWQHPGNFDLGICEAFIRTHAWNAGELVFGQTPSCKADFEDKAITINMVEDGLFREMNGWRQLTEDEFEKAYDRFRRHLARVQEKYPDYKLRLFNPAGILNGTDQRLFSRVIEDGLFEETGPVLPTEAEIADWNAVRQLDREGLVREMLGVEEPRVEARPRPLRGLPQLQPGFVPDDEFLAAVERARENLRVFDDEAGINPFFGEAAR